MRDLQKALMSEIKGTNPSDRTMYGEPYLHKIPIITARGLRRVAEYRRPITTAEYEMIRATRMRPLP